MSLFSRGVLVLGLLCLAGCKNQEPEVPSSATPPPVPPAIAPGSVALTGNLSGCADAGRLMHCTLTVSSVQEYGAGTMQLPSGTQLLVSVRPTILDEWRSASGAEVEGPDHTMTIIAERPAPDDPELPAWRIGSMDLP